MDHVVPLGTMLTIALDRDGWKLCSLLDRSDRCKHTGGESHRSGKESTNTLHRVADEAGCDVQERYGDGSLSNEVAWKTFVG